MLLLAARRTILPYIKAYKQHQPARRAIALIKNLVFGGIVRQIVQREGLVSRYFVCLPFHLAESGSLTRWTVHFLSLPSAPVVTSNALEIRIVFPLVGGNTCLT